MKKRILRYKGKDIIVTFSVDRCTHVAECLRGAPKVFDTTRLPWVVVDAEPADRVAEVVLRCPTGSLHFQRTDGGPQESIPPDNTIILNRDGPLYIHGDIEILDENGDVLLKDTRVSLCRCGQSNFGPFCDGAHIYSDFTDDGDMPPRPYEKRAEGTESTPLKIKLRKNGPLLLTGPFTILNATGETVFQDDKAALCRCGASEKKPFCDGSHNQIRFRTTEE